MDMERYAAERKQIIAEFGKKRLAQVVTVLSIGLAAVLAVLAIGGLLLKNIPVTAVVALVIGLFTILYARIRAVTVKHAMEERLHKVEDEHLIKKY